MTFGLRRLREKCLNFIDSRAQDVLRTPAFHELSPAALIPVLRSDHLLVDEVELVAATRHWARVSSVSPLWASCLPFLGCFRSPEGSGLADL